MHTFSKIAAFTSVLSLAGREAFAANDWSKPCINGECSYDLPSSHPASGSVKIWGSSNGISDITEAAGWKIIECDSDSMTPTIRMVCTGGSACDHVMQDGPVHKLVRLPEHCGKMPFARVAKAWIPDNQTVPASTKRGLFLRAPPVVHALSLDTNFSAADVTKTGNVSFMAAGMNVPGLNGNFTITDPDQRKRSYISRPVMFARSNQQPSADIFSILGFNQTSKTNLPSVDVSEQKTLFNSDIQCDGVDVALEADIAAKLHSEFSLGAVIAGTTLPPAITEFGILVGYTGSVNATLHMKAAADGTFDSGLIPIFGKDMPGLDIPGIMSIDASFAVNGQVTGTVDLDLDVSVDLTYSVNNAQLEFPSGPSGHSGDLNPNDNNFKLSASPELVGNANIAAHLTPTIDLSFNIFSGAVAAADVFVDFDASTTVNLTGVDAKASGTTGTAGSSGSASAQGCVDITANMNAHAGAKGDVLGVANKDTQVTIFNKDFDILQKCFDAKTPGDNSTDSSTAVSSTATDATSTASDASSTADATSTDDSSSTDSATATDSTSATSSSTTEASTATVSPKPVGFSSNSKRAPHFAKRASLTCPTGLPITQILDTVIRGKDQKLKA